MCLSSRRYSFVLEEETKSSRPFPATRKEKRQRSIHARYRVPLEYSLPQIKMTLWLSCTERAATAPKMITKFCRQRRATILRCPNHCALAIRIKIRSLASLLPPKTHFNRAGTLRQKVENKIGQSPKHRISVQGGRGMRGSAERELRFPRVRLARAFASKAATLTAKAAWRLPPPRSPAAGPASNSR